MGTSPDGEGPGREGGLEAVRLAVHRAVAGQDQAHVVSQAREAIRQSAEMGHKVGLIKIKSLRPFPTEAIREACKNAKRILIPEFNHAGWLYKDICSTLYGHSKAKIAAGPRVYGGMTMPTEMILEWLEEFRK